MSQGRVGSLELDQDLEYQRKEWAVQHAGWVVMALSVIAALLGVFATGPLSSTSVSTDNGDVRIEYGRFARHEAFTTLQLTLSPDAVKDGAIQVRANQAFLDTWSIETITPEPDSTDLTSDGISWTFSAGDLSEPGRIELRVKPESIGVGHGRLGLVGRESVAIRQVIYP